MEHLGRLSKKNFYRIIILCGALILLASVEVLAKAKDLDYFEFVNQSLSTQGSSPLSYETFVTSLIAAYLGKIIIPAGLAFNTWIAFVKTGYNRLFVFSWSVFLLAALAYHLLTLELTSIFYYLTVLFYLILLFLLIRLPRQNQKEEGA